MQWCSQFNEYSTANGKTQIPLRLIVPASQCGSLIGEFAISFQYFFALIDDENSLQFDQNFVKLLMYSVKGKYLMLLINRQKNLLIPFLQTVWFNKNFSIVDREDFFLTMQIPTYKLCNIPPKSVSLNWNSHGSG